MEFGKTADLSFLQGKTPISYLQELCTKRGITPQYDLIANEGAVHEPTFVFKVTGGEFIGTGKGPSKKKAKHNAALSILTQMMGLANGQTQMVEDFSPPIPQSPNDSMVGNPVGELQELTQKRLWPPPIYEFTSEQGPPHAREFICTARLWKLTETGVGKSKKLAKRNAAYAMLQLLKQGMTIPQGEGEQPEDYDDEAIPLPNDGGKTYTNMKDGKRVPTLTPQASQKITQFYQTMKNAPGKSLAALHSKPLNSSTTNYCQMLQEIAEEQRFEVTYVDIQELSHSGQRQCLVQLSTMPVAVCHGLGTSTDDARAMAAHNSLQYLRIMTKK
jgi:RISC-loading complex subunit TARBP2